MQYKIFGLVEREVAGEFTVSVGDGTGEGVMGGFGVTLRLRWVNEGNNGKEGNVGKESENAEEEEEEGEVEEGEGEEEEEEEEEDN